jgi:hypothetical protein
VLNKLYLTLGSLLLVGYTWVAFTGREFGDESRQVIPAEQRNQPGGYRTSHFWIMGYRGGK